MALSRPSRRVTDSRVNRSNRKSANPNAGLHPDVRDRVEALDLGTCEEWGGDWVDGVCRVRPLPLAADHSERTVVRSAADGLDAFERYTDFFEYVLETHERTSDTAVLLPCGAQKPIGSSAIHQKKLDALAAAGYRPAGEVIIISEPCTVIPHGMRLSRPAVNYDFPPEYTDPNEAPAVFDIFTDRLARWIDESGYETLVAYLVSGHMEKLDAALEKCDASPKVVRIPGASLGLESMAYSGDLFKSLDDITAKLEFVRAYKDEGDTDLVADRSEEVREFYAERFEGR